MTAIAKWSAWRRISQTVEWRLTTHFFGAMFDFGILTPAGADSLTHFLMGGIGCLLALGLGATRVYAAKYAALSGAHSPEPYRLAVLGDDLFLIGLPMLILALLTVLVSHSVFPDERDFRILSPLPVRRIVIVRAKLAALGLYTGMFIAVIHLALAPLMLLTCIGRYREHAIVWRFAASLISSVTASLFSVLAITALSGALMLVLSRTRFHSLSALAKSGMLTALVLCIPFVFHLPGLGRAMSARADWLMLLPPSWFVGLEHVLLGSFDSWFLRLAMIAATALLLASSVVAGVYIVLFRHFEALLLRPPSVSCGWLRRLADSQTVQAFARTRWTGAAAPAFRAVRRFTAATFARSQLHQGVIIGLSACGLSLALRRLVGSDLMSHIGSSNPPSLSFMGSIAWAPFALMFVCGIGIRAAIALPMAHHANWIFRMTESEEGRREEMRAVNHLAIAYVVGPPVALAVVVMWLLLGSAAAIIAAFIVSAVGVVFVHLVLLDWRRIPFTCSYLPGKRLVAHTLVFGFAAFALFTSAGSVLLGISAIRPSIPVAIASALFALGWFLQRRRFAMWLETPLIFDDDLPDQPLQLGL
jgi:hypothetical protein